jgi:hypothetical protein
MDFVLLQIFVAPPLHRCQPYWYFNNFVTITAGFASAFGHCHERILILPPYECSPTSFNVDGVHFTPGEGERYLSIFSQSDLLSICPLQLNAVRP